MQILGVIAATTATTITLQSIIRCWARDSEMYAASTTVCLSQSSNRRANSLTERPKKRSRTIGERVGEAVYNTAVLAGGIGVAAYRYWKGGNDADADAQHASTSATTSFSPDQRIPGAFNFRDTDRDEDYVDIVDNNVRSGTSTPTRTPRKKMYRVHSRYRTVQSPKSVTKSGKNTSTRKGGSKKSNTDDNDESSRLDSMSA